MADVNDAGDLKGKLRRRKEQVVQAAKHPDDRDKDFKEHLDDAVIDDRDKSAIIKYEAFRKTRGKSINTRIADTSTLRNAAQRAEWPLLDFDFDRLSSLFSTLEGEYNLSESGMYGYQRALRGFYYWLEDETEKHGERDYSWYDSIAIQSPDASKPDDDDLLTVSDVESMKEACNNSRDRAIIAFLSDGHRVTLVSQLRVGDVDIQNTDDPTWEPNEDGVGQKGVPDSERTLIWSAADVRQWLRDHPDSENNQAPLFTVTNYDSNNPEECALSPDGIRSALRRIANRAGVEDKSINPHSFRAAAITHFVNDLKLTPSQIQHMTGWTDDALRMLNVYDRTGDKTRNNNIREAAGLPTAEEEENESFEALACWNCGEEGITSKTCPRCGVTTDPAERVGGTPEWLELFAEITDDEGFANDLIERQEVTDASDLGYLGYQQVTETLHEHLVRQAARADMEEDDQEKAREIARQWDDLFGDDGPLDAPDDMDVDGVGSMGGTSGIRALLNDDDDQGS
ncbi:tyrosine-type recombinase/integrase [Halomarina salina]|uniref:Tyrosine-type recombinase/integrase n=1 Tax=Halomarina salina TaxID=1872699 RepID=A0ABD5RPP0_9EURY|nr:site-specific integrase [Halomarina salina]